MFFNPKLEGSPPPTRGTLKEFFRLLIKTGITPAYAGNTSSFLCVSVLDKDHPRLRGEHLDKFNKSELLEGSPPPTRGTPHRWNTSPARNGITPAYAGNTYRYRYRGSERGSPPPTRGTQMRFLPLFYLYRITPAYAGNTEIQCPVAVLYGDHPRLRGEHFTALGFQKARRRITPAYAGNTLLTKLAIP